MEMQEIIKNLKAVRAETLQRLSPLTQDQLDARPPEVDGKQEWSLGEVFMHIAIDEFYLRELIARPLLMGVKPPEGIKFLPPPPPYGAPKDVIQFWLQRAREETYHFFEEMPDDINLDLKHEGGLSQMNGLEWFLGYAGHEAFHHQHIDDLVRSMA
jgi:hypothetical protein